MHDRKPRAHFALRRLEWRHGKETVRAAYERLFRSNTSRRVNCRTAKEVKDRATRTHAILQAGFKLNRKSHNEVTRTLCACMLVASALLMDRVALGAEQFASAEEARAMLDRAVIALKANEAAALKAFDDEKNKSFRDRDLYIFCFSLPDGKFTAYQSPLMLGTDIRELMLDKDPIGQRAYDAVAKAAEGDVVSIDYSFPKPGSKQPATKTVAANAHRQSGVRRELLQIATIALGDI